MYSKALLVRTMRWAIVRLREIADSIPHDPNAPIGGGLNDDVKSVASSLQFILDNRAKRIPFMKRRQEQREAEAWLDSIEEKRRRDEAFCAGEQWDDLRHEK